MKLTRRICAGLCALALAPGMQADTFTSLVAESRAADAEAQAAQQRIDHIADGTRDMLAQYRAATRQADALSSYNARLEAQVARQETRSETLAGTMARVAGMQRELLPLLASMVDALERFVELDLPFQLGERRERVVALRAALDSPTLPLAAKYRQVLEAYRIEDGYGRALASYRERVQVGSANVEALVLRIGRIALLCQTPDGTLTARWDPQASAWQELEDAQLRRDVARGLRIAAGQRAADLLTVPVAAPGAAP